MNKYYEIKKREDVTVKNMLEIYGKSSKYRKKITWDTFYLITGWTHIQITKDERQNKK